ncbi:hypothetical protein [Vibrio bathopelagicus]
MRTQFNCCKSYGCKNLANPDLSLYQRSVQLGFESYKCPLCGAFTPILENEPILLLSKQVEDDQLRLPNVECPSCQTHTRTHAYGYTKIGTPRIKCQQCASVFGLLNPHKTSATLQPLLDLLIEGVLPQELLQKSQLNNKLFYARLKKLGLLLRQINQLLIQQYLSDTEGGVAFYTASASSLSRSGKGGSLKCWNLSTTESRYGFHILNTDNLYINNDQSSQIGRYYLDTVETTAECLDDPFKTVQSTYDRIFARSKFDELGYAHQTQCQSNEGSILRPVYATHAHWISLSKMLPKYHSFDFFLEHESFIRGSAITNLTPEICTGRFNLYYLYAKKTTNISPSIQHKNIGWWGETWSTLTKQYPSGCWNITFCALTANKQPNLEFNGTEWHQDYQRLLNQWLPNRYQKILSHHMSKHWREVFTYLYNFTYCSNRSSHFPDFDFTSIDDIVTLLNTFATRDPTKR